tara:strand:- start:2447 stop:2803 length:357 start_codon:yes stop_codon:yes gene_type:complete
MSSTSTSAQCQPKLLTPEYFMDTVEGNNLRLYNGGVTANKLRLQNNTKNMDSVETKDLHITKMTLLVREIPYTAELWWYDFNYGDSNHLWEIGWKWILELPYEERRAIEKPVGVNFSM